MMFNGLIQVILVLWFVATSESDVCSENICQCTNFGKTRLIVKCRVHGYISTGIPSNTIELDLSSCSLNSITEDIFKNLTVLKKLDLSNNSLRHIPQNTFRNTKKLEIIYLSENSISGNFYLPEKVSSLTINDNSLSMADMKVILTGLTRLQKLHLDVNPLGPSLPTDIFAGFENLIYLSMKSCNLENIDNGTFRAMRHLQFLDLSFNNLTHIHQGTMEGLTDQLKALRLQKNKLETIGDGFLKQLKNLKKCYLDYNKLTSVPDLTGPDSMVILRLQSNKIRDLSRIATSGIGRVFELRLGNNKIDLLPINIFQNTSVVESLDLSSNSLQSLPDNVFKRLDQLNTLVLTFNNITHINKHTFSGLSSLTTLFLIKNNITFIAKDAFDGTPRLKSL